MTAKPHLIIIPGRGDRQWIYRLVKPWWMFLGFRVHIFVFGWNNDRTPLKKAQERLNAYIKNLDGPLYVIGVSAGGTAAVNAHASNPNITKVVTVCTPYTPLPHRPKNQLIAQSIRHTTQTLAAMSDETKATILCLHALYDQVVPAEHNRPLGIRAKQLLAIGHGPAIATALFFYSWTIRSFFVR